MTQTKIINRSGAFQIYELHIFGNGVHGLLLCDEMTASSHPGHVNSHCKVWFDLAVNGLKRMFWKQ